MKPKLLLVEDAILRCDHTTGVVSLSPIQSLVAIRGKRVLTEPDPEGRPIVGCSNIGGNMKPCLTTLAVQQGYSDLIRINGRRVCLEAVKGLTDGTPPGIVNYSVTAAGQNLVKQR